MNDQHIYDLCSSILSHTPVSVYIALYSLISSMLSQPFRHHVLGLFYGTDAHSRHFVPVPVDLGLKHYGHLDDFATHYWVKTVDRHIISLSTDRVRLSRFPRLKDCVLANDYTIVFENQGAALIENRLLAEMSKDILWWGNVLVVKHNGQEMRLVDVTEEDVVLVDLILIW
jgi:hypothetical protein